jgi:phosphatidylinositol glycan class A protein
MANGLKVYHIPQVPFCAENVAFVTFFSSLPLIRQILIREQIDIVHGHQSVSILQNIVLMTAKTLGLKTVFTEHSLFTYHDYSAVHINKLIKWTFRDLDASICVSNACKDNYVLRAKVDPKQTFVIPNAVDFNKFIPNPEIREAELKNNPERINIVFISRLMYRKGIDLLIPIIPKILAKFENVHFIIGGDGPGMTDLKVMLE